MDIPKRYVEDGTRVLTNKSFLPEGVYQQCIQAMVVVCADTVLIDQEAKVMYLAKRVALPCPDWWFIGGRVAVGETELAAVQRTFQRETSLLMDEDRFSFLKMNRYWWKDRAQEPQHFMSDGLAYTFVLEPTKSELEVINTHLEPREYDVSVGIQAFNLERLKSEFMDENVRDIHLDNYDAIFGNK